jgi:hypothetical protein
LSLIPIRFFLLILPFPTPSSCRLPSPNTLHTLHHSPAHKRRELTLPIAKYLGVPKENVFANRMNWQWDDETGEPSRLVGFDMNEPTAHNQVGVRLWGSRVQARVHNVLQHHVCTTVL